MNIIELAKEAGFDIDEGLFPFEASEDKFIGTERTLERFAALVRAEALAEHKCGGCAKTAADGWALYCVECWEKAEPVKQEPVAWALSHSLGLEFGSKFPMCKSKERAEELASQHMGDVVVTPLYAAPVSAKRELVELTVSDLDAIIEKHYDDEMDLKAMILDGIAALKEKNK